MKTPLPGRAPTCGFLACVSLRGLSFGVSEVAVICLPPLFPGLYVRSPEHLSEWLMKMRSLRCLLPPAFFVITDLEIGQPRLNSATPLPSQCADGDRMFFVEGNPTQVGEAVMLLTDKLIESGVSNASALVGQKARAAQGTKRKIGDADTIVLHIPRNQIGSVIGKAGSNITQIRQISTAAVKVHNADPVTGEHQVEITGSTQDCRAAENLVQVRCCHPRAGPGPNSQTGPPGHSPVADDCLPSDPLAGLPCQVRRSLRQVRLEYGDLHRRRGVENS